MKEINKTIGISGSYEFTVKNSSGEVVEATGEQSNLITDDGVDMFARSGGLTIAKLVLGSGVVTTPAVTDTNLGNETYVSSAFNMTFNSMEQDPQGIRSRYSATVVIKNTTAEFSEVGLKKPRVYTGQDYLITRSLIKDASGQPTTISVNADQELHITYYIYLYAPWELGGGVTPTPHGDLHWKLVMTPPSNSYRYPLTGNNINTIGNAMKDPFGRAYGITIIQLGGTATESIDFVTRTKTFTVKANPATSSKTYIAGSLFVNREGNDFFSARIETTQDYTIPANHDFEISFSVTWGRMA